MTDAEFLMAFEETTLPRPEWTHAAHLRMAFLYLIREPATEQALRVVRQRIQAYNLSKGNPRGYHETITVAFVRLIADALRRTPIADFAALQTARPDLFHSEVLLRFYTRERLYSPEARAVFVEPDGDEPLP
jgi:hypothetical protein